MGNRVVYRVKWSDSFQKWVHTGVRGARLGNYGDKARAVREARLFARATWTEAGTLCQLVVHGKNGRIQYEHTYGRDPRRHKG